MTHLRRVATEQALQAVAILMTLLDRLLLTALLYRIWGAASFEVWSLCAALAGLASLCELGFNMYFANRLMIETETGAIAKAARTMRLGNTVFAGCAALGLVVTLALLAVFGVAGSNEIPASDKALAVFLLAVATALRLGLASVHSLYRANRQFARYTTIIVSGEIVRIVAVAGVVLAGGGIVAAGLATLFATAAFQGAYIAYDVRRRFKMRAFGFLQPTFADLHEIVPPSAAYFGQIIPLVLLTHGPVLLVTGASKTTGIVAAFVLLRTLGGLPRGLLQSLGAVLGQECARRLTVGDTAGAFAVLATGTRAFSVLSGLCAGLLIAGGRDIVAVWTGNADLFRADYMLAALTPMLVVAASVIMHNVLASNNTPGLAAAGRLLQLGLTVAIATLAPIPDAGLRVMVALSAGEILGFSPLAYWAVHRLIPPAGVRFHLLMLGLTAGATVAAAGLTTGALDLASTARAGRIVALGAACAGCAGLFMALGIDKPLRAQLIAQSVEPAMARALAAVRALVTRPGFPRPTAEKSPQETG